MQPEPAAGAPTVTDPSATGDAAGDLAGAATPDDPELSATAAAVPMGLAAGSWPPRRCR